MTRNLLKSSCRHAAYLLMACLLLLFTTGQGVAQTDTITNCAAINATTQGGTDGSLSMDLQGLTAPYTYAWQTAPPQFSSSINNIPKGVYPIILGDANGFVDTIYCAVGEPYNGCYSARTQTMGGWGSKPRGGNPGMYRYNNFASAFPDGLTIGCPDQGGYFLHLTSQKDVQNFLPSGSTAKALTSDKTNPGKGYKNVLAGQVAALTLSTTFDLYDPSFGQSYEKLIFQEIASGPLSGWTVEQLLDECNKALGGCGSSFGFSLLNDVASKVNENFVSQKKSGSYINCVPTMGASIGDFVWNDLNGDGSADAGEPGIADVDLDLWSAGPDGVHGNGDDVLIGSTSTNSQGVYYFEELRKGDYRVVVDAASLPTSFVSTGAGNTKDVDLDYNENYIWADFGYRATAKVGDYVWADKNGDGVQDPSESGIGGITVHIHDSGSNLVATTQTNSSGYYEFDNLFLGTYSVSVVETNLSFNAYTQTGGTNPQSTPTLTAGQFYEDADFGFQQLARIGDLVWKDDKGDGVKDATESGIAGATVELIDVATNTVIQTTTTDANGLYSFENLPLGNYRVHVVESTLGLDNYQQSGGTNSTPPLALTASLDERLDADFGFQPLGSLGDLVWADDNGNGVQDAGEAGLDNVELNLYDANNVLLATTTTGADGSYLFDDLPSGNYSITVNQTTVSLQNFLSTGAATPTGTISLAAGENQLDHDFGFQPRGSIGDYVWMDSNGDGIQDASEAGIDGVTVELLDGSNTLIATTTTDVNGLYSFPDLVKEDYTVRVDEGTLPGGLSTYLSGGSNPTGTIVLGAGDDHEDADFGYRILGGGSSATGIIGDLVWEDADGDAVYDPGSESGIANASLSLTNAGFDGVFGTADDIVLPSTQSGPDGSYLFSGLYAGLYRVTVVETGVLTGYANTTGGNTHDVNLAGSSFLDADFGYKLPLGSISGVAWEDLNADGYRTPDEPLKGNTVLELRDDQNATVGTTTTDANGDYSFEDLAAGSYTIAVVALPSNAVTMPAYALTNEGGDSKFDQTSGLTDALVLASGQDMTDVDVGMATPGRIVLDTDVETYTDAYPGFEDRNFISWHPFFPNDPDLQPYNWATYTYLVENTGGVSIDLIDVFDGDCVPVKITGVGDTKLDVGEVWLFECTKRWTWSTFDPQITYPVVTATDELGLVTSDDAELLVRPTGLNMEILASQSTVCAGDTISIKYVSRFQENGLFAAGQHGQLVDLEFRSNLIDNENWQLGGPSHAYFADASGDHVSSIIGASAVALDVNDGIDEDCGGGFADWVHEISYVVPSDISGQLVITASDKAKLNFYDGTAWHTLPVYFEGADTLVLPVDCPQAMTVQTSMLDLILNGGTNSQENEVSNSQNLNPESEIEVPLLAENLTFDLVEAYPNPFQDEIVVQLPDHFLGGKLQLLNAQGQEIRLIELTENKLSLRSTNLPAGFYFLKLMNQDKQELIKLTKNK